MTRVPSILSPLLVVTALSLTLCELQAHAQMEHSSPSVASTQLTIQGLGGKFVSRIEGCYFNVVGLPVPRVYEIMKSLSREKTQSIEESSSC